MLPVVGVVGERRERERKLLVSPLLNTGEEVLVLLELGKTMMFLVILRSPLFLSLSLCVFSLCVYFFRCLPFISHLFSLIL